MATTPSTPIMTWEAFERLPDGDGLHRELLEGELQTLPPAKSGHAKVAKKMFMLLLDIEKAASGQAFVEAGYKLSDQPATWIQPDVSFLSNDRAAATKDGQYFKKAPDLAVEVVSPSEKARHPQRKVRLLLDGGSRAVWVVYPETKTAVVHHPDGTGFTRKAGDTLSAPFLLEGWEIPVAARFEEA
jgi:Uma2 family endonuclease